MQSLDVLRVLFPLPLRFCKRNGKPDDPRNVERAAAEHPLLLSARDHGRYLHALFYDQSAHALGRIDFMPRKRNRIAKRRDFFEVEIARRLHAVGKENGVSLLTESGNFF